MNRPLAVAGVDPTPGPALDRPSGPVPDPRPGPAPDRTPGSRLHGGLIRGEVRWRGADPLPGGVGLSWYLIEPGERCSVHVHTGKVETWFFAAGQADVLWGEQRIPVTIGDAVRTPPGVPHGIVARGTEPVRFLNIVEYLDGVEVTTRELED